MKKNTVSFQGEAGAFSQIAVQQIAGPEAIPVPLPELFVIPQATTKNAAMKRERNTPRIRTFRGFMC